MGSFLRFLSTGLGDGVVESLVTGMGGGISMARAAGVTGVKADLTLRGSSVGSQNLMMGTSNSGSYMSTKAVSA